MNIFKIFLRKPSVALTPQQQRKVDEITGNHNAQESNQQYEKDMGQIHKEAKQVNKRAERLVTLIERSTSYKIAVATGRIKP